MVCRRKAVGNLDSDSGGNAVNNGDDNDDEGDDEYEEEFEDWAAKGCSDQHENCQFWANSGECEANPGYMKINCAVACKTCGLSAADRCPLNPDAKRAFGPGGLSAIFVNRTTDPAIHAKYPVNVLSRDPWVVTFDDFVTDEEITALLETNKGKFERSTDAGELLPDGTLRRIESSSRTSENAWCNHEDCQNNEVVNNLIERIAELTMVPGINQEYFQVLKYEVGQYYVSHNDFIPTHVDMPCGPRVSSSKPLS